MVETETIVARATPAGRGGVGIIRVSGPLVVEITQQLVSRRLKPRIAEYLSFAYAGQLIDNGIALYFPRPNSFTGEDVLELQGHGGPVVLDMLVAAVLACGARLARPGEFSERAFLNNKLDLAQAEAVADLIDSASEQAARAAVRTLQGEFSNKINSILKELIALRTYVEAAIDFPEEEIDFLADEKILQQIDNIQNTVSQTLSAAQQGMLLTEGMVIVIAGRPNVGKSSLINCLSGEDKAIVTPVAGTTRDVIRVDISLNGICLHIIDTAGLRESDDPVEQEGIKRAWKEIENADHILYLIDAQLGIQDSDEAILDDLNKTKQTVQLVYNKVDLCAKNNKSKYSDFSRQALQISVKTGVGIEQLKALLLSNAGQQNSAEGQFTARRRHVDALHRALESISLGKKQLLNLAAGELLAEELRCAQMALAEITGEFSSDDLLGEIFSSFCIGK
ncbi:MAG: tRNA uridine-5-carboxymethylaminomethyl(34) synthesis GTPase MnmE [Thiohalomonadales bacterium]